MLIYGNYMSGTELKWKCLFFLFILSCFDLIMKQNKYPHCYMRGLHNMATKNVSIAIWGEK
jgi:hypothetical protein